MLDKLNVIKQRDPQDYLGFAAQQPKQLLVDFGIAEGARPRREIKHVVFAGMGGSSLVAELVHTWPKLRVPFVVCKEYNIPDFVDEHTLFIASSYSGNTEETLSALAQAEKRKAQIFVAAYSGKLHEIAKARDYVYAAIPHCPQPRAGVFYMYRAVVEIFVAAGLVPAKTIGELESVVDHLET